MAVDLPLLLRIHGKLAGHVKYKLGAKARATQQTFEIEELDCSGYVRYLLQRCGAPSCPDGTWAQFQWLARRDWKPWVYENLLLSTDSPRLFVAGWIESSDARGRRRHGHIWLVHQGKTIECYGRVGVGSRASSYRTLRRHVRFCYEVPLKGGA